MEASGGSTAEAPVEAATTAAARSTFHAQNLASVLNNPLAADPAAAASASLGTAVVQLGAAGEGLWRGDWSTALDQLGAAAASVWEVRPPSHQTPPSRSLFLTSVCMVLSAHIASLDSTFY
jgi:Flp pilus assembly protein TadG